MRPYIECGKQPFQLVRALAGWRRAKKAIGNLEKCLSVLDLEGCLRFAQARPDVVVTDLTTVLGFCHVLVEF